MGLWFDGGYCMGVSLDFSKERATTILNTYTTEERELFLRLAKVFVEHMENNDEQATASRLPEV